MRLYRPAVVAGAGRNLLKTALQTAAFWGLFLFVLPAGLVALGDRAGLPRWPLPWCGGFLFAVAGGLGLWSGAVMAVRGRGTPLPMDTARELVRSGPYRWVRNPMALAGIAQGMGVALWTGSALVLAYALSGAVLWHTVARPGEERDLEQRFGDAYRRYRAAVPLWLPRRPR
ncbi:MAG: isoprenylcysteine carboxylmethyltransferase family protein [Planctomycetota bacterium]